jgi:uridine phosphorylase
VAQQILPITGLVTGGVSPDVIVCGDPQRAEAVAAFLTDVELLADQREYRSYAGHYRGLPLTVCSHGVGAPGAAIAFEELIIAGARRVLRVGTCGGLQPEINDGHLVIATAAVQNTGYGLEIAPHGFPAAADARLSIALEEAAASRDLPVTSGIVLTRDAFYNGVAAPYRPDYAVMSEANVQAVEMECAALFTIGALRRVRTAAILAVDGNVLHTVESADTYRPHRDSVALAVDAAIKSALEELAAVNGK